MKIFLPDNFIFHLFSDSLPATIRQQVIFKPSALISASISEIDAAVGIIPTIDLIFHKDFFISSKFGVAFEGQLSTTYLYFKSESKKISDLILSGDVSSFEPIIAKILFKELYDIEIEIRIEQYPELIKNENSIISGDYNFSSGLFKKGISLAEEMSDFLALPFVNFILASKDENLLNSFQNSLLGISDEIYSSVEEDKLLLSFNDDTNEFIKSKISSIVFDFEQNEIDGINHLLLLPYYHGMVKEIVELKLV
ncbi:MAG: hypothetical protein IPH11_05265 [Ignavibacteriales bacterium]|nr:hypothetical protein [Ignavibacteriales bacterium]